MSCSSVNKRVVKNYPALLGGEMQAMLWARDAADARHIKDTGREISQVLHTKVRRCTVTCQTEWYRVR